MPEKPAASFRVALAALILTLAGLLSARFGLLPPYTAFRIFVLGAVVGGLLSLIFGLVALLRGRLSQRPLPRKTWAGTLIGLAFVIGLLVVLLPHIDAPPIHDITTRPDDPPHFVEVLQQVGNAERDLTYPHGGDRVPSLQREAYPDLQPIVLSVGVEDAFALSRQVAEELGWVVLWANAEQGIIEANETSSMFRFVDDIVIRVRPTAEGSVIDLRSTSRVGISDLGSNAKRIRQFTERVQSRL